MKSPQTRQTYRSDAQLGYDQPKANSRNNQNNFTDMNNVCECEMFYMFRNLKTAGETEIRNDINKFYLAAVLHCLAKLLVNNARMFCTFFPGSSCVRRMFPLFSSELLAFQLVQYCIHVGNINGQKMAYKTLVGLQHNIHQFFLNIPTCGVRITLSPNICCCQCISMPSYPL